MNKKIITLVFLSIILSMPLSARSLVIHYTSGSTTNILLSDEPTITFNGDSLMIRTINANMSISMVEAKYYTYSNITTGIGNVNDNVLKKDAEIYSLNGVLLIKGNTVDIDSLPKGVYIIKSGKETIKISKR